MFIFGYFFEAVATVVHSVLYVYMWIVLIRAVLSWVNPDPYNPIVMFIHNMTEPVLYQIRKRLPVDFGGIDVSPILIFLVIIFLDKFLVASLYRLATIPLFR
ncbi:MAG: YggT family protein [Desulfobacterales bacterium]|nr:YggT family protein [Desulfobacterales bacterium]